MLVDAILHSKALGSDLAAIVLRVRRLLRLVRWWELRHYRRESNLCVNCLVGLACVSGDRASVVHFTLPPNVVSSLLLDDLAGGGSKRRVRM